MLIGPPHLAVVLRAVHGAVQHALLSAGGTLFVQALVAHGPTLRRSGGLAFFLTAGRHDAVPLLGITQRRHPAIAGCC